MPKKTPKHRQPEQRGDVTDSQHVRDAQRAVINDISNRATQPEWRENDAAWWRGKKTGLGEETSGFPLAIVARQPWVTCVDVHTEPFTPAIQIGHEIKGGPTCYSGHECSHGWNYFQCFHTTASDQQFSITGDLRSGVSPSRPDWWPHWHMCTESGFQHSISMASLLFFFNVWDLAWWSVSQSQTPTLKMN